MNLVAASHARIEDAAERTLSPCVTFTSQLFSLLSTPQETLILLQVAKCCVL